MKNNFVLQPLFDVAPQIVFRSLIKWSFLSPIEKAELSETISIKAECAYHEKIIEK